MLAATAPLATLEQELADRRLAAELDHAGHEWRVCTTLAPIAAPLWLGESLVALAQSFVEAEAGSHPDRPDDLSPVTHALVATLLQPVEAIIAEVSAALVDPARSSGLTAPLTVGPRGVAAAYPLPFPIPLPYARGLLLAARRIQGAAQLALDDTGSLVGRSPAPDWLTAALRRVGGELHAAAARVGMAETRLVLVLHAARADNETLAPLCADLWDALNTVLVAGQMLREPHLLPGAPPVSAPQISTYTQTMPAPAPLPPSVPRPQPPAPSPIVPATPRQQPPVTLPRIAPDQASSTPSKTAVPERPFALPRIEEGARDATSPVMREPSHRPDTPAPPRQRDAQAPALPHIGEPDAPQNPAPHRDAPHQAVYDASHDEPQPFRLPDIGTER